MMGVSCKLLLLSLLFYKASMGKAAAAPAAVVPPPWWSYTDYTVWNYGRAFCQIFVCIIPHYLCQSTRRLRTEMPQCPRWQMSPSPPLLPARLTLLPTSPPSITLRLLLQPHGPRISSPPPRLPGLRRFQQLLDQGRNPSFEPLISCK